MSSEQNEDRAALEARANELGVQFQANIGDAKLKKRVREAEEKAASSAGGEGEGGGKPAASQPSPKAKGRAQDTYVIVTGPKQGRRRAGRRFAAEPVTLKVSELAEGDLAALKADAALTVVDAD